MIYSGISIFFIVTSVDTTGASNNRCVVSLAKTIETTERCWCTAGRCERSEERKEDEVDSDEEDEEEVAEKRGGCRDALRLALVAVSR